jgi:hypothetical protein
MLTDRLQYRRDRIGRAASDGAADDERLQAVEEGHGLAA